MALGYMHLRLASNHSPPHNLPYRILTDTQPLGGVLNRPDLGVSLPHPLLEGRVGWVSAQRLPCLLEVPRHRGAVEAEALGDLNCHLREEQRTHCSLTSCHFCAAIRCLLTVSRPKPSSRPISM